MPVEVGCLHCGETFMSDRIVLRHDAALGELAWCCPTPGCDACGFGFDLLPTDPTYRDEHGGWVSDDDEEDEALGPHVDEAVLDAHFADDGALPPVDAPDGPRDDAEEERRRRRHERLFGEPPRLPEDDIPF